MFDGYVNHDHDPLADPLHLFNPIQDVLLAANIYAITRNVCEIRKNSAIAR